MSEQWFTEKHTPHSGLTLEYTRRLYDAHSDFQHVEVIDTPEYGRMLLLDGFVMLSERDEFIYHEMITHVPLFSHGDARDVLIIGGGDGGTLRECLRHKNVQSATLVEIDEMVLAVSREFFPALSKSLDEPRATVLVADGFEHLRNQRGAYDVIIVDSIDPVGEAAKLFTEEFYGMVRGALRPGGVAAFQTESPFFHGHVLRNTCNHLRGIFKHVAPYLAHIPTYPSGLWSFTLASDRVDPRGATPSLDVDFIGDLKYFTPQIYPAAFVLPAYIRRAIGG